MIDIIDNYKIAKFLEANGISFLSIKPIKQDASSRRYFRINNNLNTLLMDSPSIDNNNYEFIKISEYLNEILFKDSSELILNISSLKGKDLPSS